ncbi:MAG: small, acid-soluble spore protein, alpha/beta type [Firmicutes bacterium]|nr:small, acid-soluble spore protein, alpha/beta type [Bacillota bacterium]
MQKKKELTQNDIMKYEIAAELGLTDKIEKSGWKSLTAKESGQIGGLMTKRKRSKTTHEKGAD